MSTSKNNNVSRYLLWLAIPLIGTTVQADQLTRAVVYDKERGELSPGTEAPTPERMLNAIRSASPTAMTAMLEYGERVECMECIPVLQKKLLESDDARVREISAWWLRKRPFGYARAAVRMRDVALNDGDAVRRARAAEALGEFMDKGGLPALEHAATLDESADVRLAGVRALGRLNAIGGHAALVAAFEDEDARVRRAALDQVTKVVFFKDADAVVARLADEDGSVRLRAAQLTGELRASGGVEGLAELLSSDDKKAVRQAAAWSLGRLGGSDALDALRAAKDAEKDPGVIDAITIAMQMAR